MYVIFYFILLSGCFSSKASNNFEKRRYSYDKESSCNDYEEEIVSNDMSKSKSDSSDDNNAKRELEMKLINEGVLKGIHVRKRTTTPYYSLEENSSDSPEEKHIIVYYTRKRPHSKSKHRLKLYNAPRPTKNSYYEGDKTGWPSIQSKNPYATAAGDDPKTKDIWVGKLIHYPDTENDWSIKNTKMPYPTKLDYPTENDWPSIKSKIPYPRDSGWPSVKPKKPYPTNNPKTKDVWVGHYPDTLNQKHIKKTKMPYPTETGWPSVKSKKPYATTGGDDPITKDVWVGKLIHDPSQHQTKKYGQSKPPEWNSEYI